MALTTYNLADIYEALTDALPGKIAAVYGQERLTFAELDARANRLAHHWAAAGVGEGDHVGLLLYNCLEFLEGMLAALKLRAVPINVNYRYVAPELAYLFDNADMAGLVYEGELEAEVAAALRLRPVRHLLRVRGEGESAAGALDYEPALADRPAHRQGFPDRSSEDLFIVYTGGTTGMPRGVMWRHDDLLFAAFQGGNPGGEPVSSPAEIVEIAVSNVEVEGEMAILPAPPLIHGNASFSSWISWLTGGKVCLIPGRSFDPVACCEMIGAEGVSVVSIVGDAMGRPLADALAEREYDVETLLVVQSAGAVLSGSVRHKLQSLLPDVMIMNNFGSSESGHQGSAFYDEDEGEDARPQWFMKDNVVVIDEHFSRITPGSGAVGRLARTGPLPLGYYKDPEKTAATFVEFEGRRWVIPGDMATVEEDGTVTFLGRGSVCINSGGEKVYPEEVEEALKAHPSIFDALVVGLADERWGQRVEAVISLREGHALTEDEVRAFCRQRLAGYKVPRRVHRVPEVVRHPSGKPDYKWAREVAGG